MGVCPFHNDKGPSLSVSPEKGLFHCFGCGKSGTVITFLMEYESLTFPEALDRFARELGISLDRKEDEYGDRLKRVNNLAMDYFYQNLMFNEAGKDARLYLSKRKITKETIETFRLGLAPDGWHGFTDYLRSKNASLDDAEKLGLIRTSNGSTYDIFRNRLMFPILDTNGNAIAFGGRTLDDEQQPKYLNSPETPLFKKSNVLYGYHASRQEINRRKEVILVEGYMDLLSMVQNGVPNVAAVLGTAFTEQHVKVLVNRAENVYLFLDSDEAGIRAMLRSLEILFQSPFAAYVIINPFGKDPDELMSTQGREAFDELKRKAVNGFDFYVDRQASGEDMSNPNKKALVYKKLEAYFNSIPDETLRYMYMQRLDERFGMIKRRKSITAAEKQASPHMPAFSKDDIFLLMFVMENSSFAREIFDRIEHASLFVQHDSILSVLKKLYSAHTQGEDLFVKGNTQLFIEDKNVGDEIALYVTKNTVNLTHDNFVHLLAKIDKKIGLYQKKGGVV